MEGKVTKREKIFIPFQKERDGIGRLLKSVDSETPTKTIHLKNSKLSLPSILVRKSNPLMRDPSKGPTRKNSDSSSLKNYQDIDAEDEVVNQSVLLSQIEQLKAPQGRLWAKPRF